MVLLCTAAQIDVTTTIIVQTKSVSNYYAKRYGCVTCWDMSGVAWASHTYVYNCSPWGK